MRIEKTKIFIFYNYYSEFILIIDSCKFFLFFIKKNSKKKIMKQFTLPLILPAVLLMIAGLLIMPTTNGEQLAFAESEVNSTLKVSDKLKKNPLAMQIIAEMEAQKLRYKQLSEESIPKVIPTREQILIEENRKISEEMLQNDLESMNNKYLDFTPKNAFAKFVEKLNSSHHGIFWDQFDYLDAKVQLAIAAKNDILENGGTFYEAQREYFKYASMPRLEMISYIQELNVKYGFANEDIQSNFDPKGKLPRFEDDKDAPCYGCENTQAANNSNSQSNNNQVNIVSSNVEIDPKGEIKFLQEKLSNLRQAFLKSDNIKEKKYLVDSLNDTVKKIQELTY